jgi:hypothetical protein
MQDHPKGAADGYALTTHEEDERDQAAILHLVLELHPAALTQGELVRELAGGGSQSFSDFDAVERGVRGLAGAGLLHRPGEDEMIRPTRAAVRCFELNEQVV